MPLTINIYMCNLHVLDYICSTSVLSKVWCCIVSKPEAVRRIVERDRKTEEEAVRRIESQPSNAEVVARSNVVFCAQWSEAFSLRQAQKAWRRVMDQIDRDQVA